MEKIELKNYKLKKETRYDLIAETSKKLNKPVGQILKLTAGISHQDLIKILHSIEALSRDKGIEFGRSFWWHINSINKQR